MRALLVRHRFFAVAVVGVLLVVLAVWTQRSGGPPLQGSLGPTPGPDSSGYVRDKTRYVLALAAEEPSRPAAALVSLGRLLRGVDVSELAAGASVDVVFVRFPARNPEALPVTDTIEVTVGMRAEEVAGEIEEQARVMEEQAQAAPDDRRGALLERAEEVREQSSVVRGECFCVYAFTVGGARAADLARLQGHDDVKLVDVPDPPVTSLRGWELRPILPEGVP